MIKRFKVNSVSEFEQLKLSNRSQGIIYEKMDYVKEIIADVKSRGDDALIEYTKKFDGIELTKDTIRVSEEEIEEAFSIVKPDFIETIKSAISNLHKYHSKQYPEDFEVEVNEGVKLGRKWSPIETVGLYIPGGRAPYVTAGYMLGVPAMVAGCKNKIICVPPDKVTGKVNPNVLVSAILSGATEVYKIGGAQAIAAMAYGTESVTKVEKIFGPGNVFVTAAKLLVYGNVDIDAPAGPSEALIIADEDQNYKFIAADILSQAEHDNDAACAFLTTSEEFAIKVDEEVERQMQDLPRKETIKKSLSNFGSIVICKDINQCIEIANVYAPEHIQIITKNSEEDAKKIINSGSVCIGEFAPIAAGDYFSGVNNVIPTGGGTKMFSPVHVEAYMKCYQTQNISQTGLINMSKSIKMISDMEGFSAHYNSVEVRLK